MDNLNYLKADAIAIMNNLDSCWAPATAITHVADTLVRLHPGVDRELAIVAAEQAAWSGWP